MFVFHKNYSSCHSAPKLEKKHNCMSSLPTLLLLLLLQAATNTALIFSIPAFPSTSKQSLAALLLASWSVSVTSSQCKIHLLKVWIGIRLRSNKQFCSVLGGIGKKLGNNGEQSRPDNQKSDYFLLTCFAGGLVPVSETGAASVPFPCVDQRHIQIMTTPSFLMVSTTQ